MNRRQFLTTTATAAGAAGLATLSGCGAGDYDFQLLNVSYDPTRELYRKVNRLFAEDYFQKTGKKIRVRQSHGGSGSQARAVNDGLMADIVSLAMWMDVDSIQRKGLIDKGWDKRYPNPENTPPYISTVVFVVRRGNPFGIRDWPHLLDPPQNPYGRDPQIITPNPKTSGGAKLNVIGAWLDVLRRGGTAGQAREFVTQLFKRVPVLDTGARGSSVTFARKNIGDVHLTWENEAHLEDRELKGEVVVVRPPVSIRAEPHVAVVDANAAKKGTTEVARAYLEFLYTPAAQDLIAELGFRPVKWEKDERFAGVKLLDATDPKYNLGDWNEIQKDFFSEGGLFDQIYAT
jgi:sulfate transport system substrate-binding protein